MTTFPVGGRFSLNGTLSDTWNCTYTNPHINLLPSVRSNTPDIPGRAGKANAGIEWSSRIVTMDLIFADSGNMLADMRAIAAELDPTGGSTTKLIFVDEDPTVYLNVVPNSDMPVERQSPGQGDMTLALEALDPFWYAVDDLTQSIVAPAGVTLYEAIVGNTGTAVAAPTYTITRPSGASGALTGVTLQVGSNSITYNGTIAAGDELVIDTDDYTITKNGVNVLSSATWVNDWPTLPVGASGLYYSDTNKVGADIVIQTGVRYT